MVVYMEPLGNKNKKGPRRSKPCALNDQALLKLCKHLSQSANHDKRVCGIYSGSQKVGTWIREK